MCKFLSCPSPTYCSKVTVCPRGSNRTMYSKCPRQKTKIISSKIFSHLRQWKNQQLMDDTQSPLQEPCECAGIPSQDRCASQHSAYLPLESTCAVFRQMYSTECIYSYRSGKCKAPSSSSCGSSLPSWIISDAVSLQVHMSRTSIQSLHWFATVCGSLSLWVYCLWIIRGTEVSGVSAVFKTPAVGWRSECMCWCPRYGTPGAGMVQRHCGLS